MAKLKNEDIRRFINFLKKNTDEEIISAIEEELKGEDFIREPEFLSYFSTSLIEIENWRLKIIPYTAMRMIQRGIKMNAIVDIFKQFLEHCRLNEEVITIGAYTILSKTEKKIVTLRIDVDKITDKEGEAHTVTVFIGYGNAENTVLLSLVQ